VAHPDYRPSTHFLHRDTFECIRKLAVGMFGLLIHFRDLAEAQEEPLPFFPWLHSTEALEHLFGIMRCQVKDFDIMDFLQMSGRAVTLMDLSREMAEHQEKNTALGYQHTYFDTHGIDLDALSTYFTDQALEENLKGVSNLLWR
jgi:hypothetical protein